MPETTPHAAGDVRLWLNDVVQLLDAVLSDPGDMPSVIHEALIKEAKAIVKECQEELASAAEAKVA